MGLVIATLMLLSPAGLSADGLLPSRPLLYPPAVVQNLDPVNFDLVDFRDEIREEVRNIRVENPHTVFVIKRHVGASIGYDNTVLHGSAGFYLTVAEWGRWNFGVPSIGVGLGRYPTYDRDGQTVTKSQPTVFVSVASVHYRMGYLRSLGVNCYINLEQVYDLRYNMSGSQFGFSFSSK